MLEGLLVFDVFGSDDDMQRPAPDRADKILLDIEVDEIAHADRRHQQDFDFRKRSVVTVEPGSIGSPGAIW